MASRLQRKFQNFTLSLDCNISRERSHSESFSAEMVPGQYFYEHWILGISSASQSASYLIPHLVLPRLGLRYHSFKIPEQETPVRLIQLPHFRGKETETEKIISPQSDEKSTRKLIGPIQLFALLHKIHEIFICIYHVLSLYNQSVSSKKKRPVLKNLILPEMMIWTQKIVQGSIELSIYSCIHHPFIHPMDR